ncbi:hypothetical protein TSAR_000112 [Trichomalopsis sarcophagae]|uniref:Peptidase M12B domain-containing protein n=1 Tax=Trichomalopsis sarcophagae TaxID=543379 RepID=A0A232EJT3_9HYME|nr:hypothetical protein TSAR_000112 [Trichomalopsis sarcophagae]
MNKHSLLIVSVLGLAVSVLSSNEFFIGSNTPVWFLESNSADSESPRLSIIPNALEEAGLSENNATLHFLDNRNDEDSHKLLKKQTKGLDELFLEILVVVDHGLYRKLAENIADALNYVVSFWNGVNLRYELITSPTVYVNIAGIILSKDPNALYYVQQSKNSRGYVNANKVLFEGGKYFLYEKRLKNYDIAVTMTTEDICSVGAADICYSNIVGLSLLGKTCHSHLNTAIIEDNGGFGGIIVATHEIAHLLGVPHDGTGEAIRCLIRDGYIMTPSASVGENNFKWSTCSQKILHKFSLSSGASCLKNAPNVGSTIIPGLSGKLMSASQQCARARYSTPCFNGKRICNALSCFRTDYKYCDADGPAAEGTTCGENLYCRGGKCVPEN